MIQVIRQKKILGNHLLQYPLDALSISYVQDMRWAKTASGEDMTDALIDLDTPGPLHHLSPSYGKDTIICPEPNADGHFMFGDDLDDVLSVNSVENTHDPHDPWQRHPDHAPTPATAIPGRQVNGQPAAAVDIPSLTQMARAGHRRTTSECLTSTTLYSSSLDSLESFTMKNMRSPLSISEDESEEGQGKPQLTPERRRAMFDG